MKYKTTTGTDDRLKGHLSFQFGAIVWHRKKNKRVSLVSRHPYQKRPFFLFADEEAAGIDPGTAICGGYPHLVEIQTQRDIPDGNLIMVVDQPVDQLTLGVRDQYFVAVLADLGYVPDLVAPDGGWNDQRRSFTGVCLCGETARNVVVIVDDHDRAFRISAEHQPGWLAEEYREPFITFPYQVADDLQRQDGGG